MKWKCKHQSELKLWTYKKKFNFVRLCLMSWKLTMAWRLLTSIYWKPQYLQYEKCNYNNAENTMSNFMAVLLISVPAFFWIVKKLFKFSFILFSPQEPFDLDELLPSIGEFGKYQKLLLWFICLPACIPCGFCAFNQIFMAG